MALNPSVEMKSSLWAGLPPELIICAIQQTDGDLKAWCEATSRNMLLHREACSRTWTAVGIGTEDFMLDPNEYRDEEWSLRPEDERGSDPDPDDRSGRRRLRRALGRLLRTNRVNPTRKINRATSVRNGIKPAALIRKLYIDFSTESSFGFPSLWSDRYEFPSPSAQTLRYTLACLFPHLEALEQLTVGGPISEEVVNAIAGLNTSKLRSLTVRTNFSTSYEFFVGSRSVYSESRPLEFSKLSTFRELRNLRINELIWGESAELIQLLPNLTSLHEFSVIVRRPQNFEECRRNSPLRSLLCSDVEPNLFTCLPVSLKVLRVVDNWYYGNKGPIVTAPTKDLSESRVPVLEELTTELDDVGSTLNLLGWTPSSRLRRLALSPACNRRRVQVDSIRATGISSVSQILAAHADTLEKIVFTNAWNIHTDFAADFNNQWQSKFVITDLILGTQDPDRKNDKLSIRNTEESHALHLHLWGGAESRGTLSDTFRWGRNVERIRIESAYAASDLSSARHCLAPDLQLPELQSLRILIISPRIAGLAPVDRPSYNAEELAWYITLHGPSTLRYISAGTTAFWIVRRGDTGMANCQGRHCLAPPIWDVESDRPEPLWLVPWHLAITQKYEHVRRDVHAWAIAADWEFIDQGSPLNSDRHQNFRNERDPPYVILQRWNKLVARSIQSS